jgi:hypothetical protein
MAGILKTKSGCEVGLGCVKLWLWSRSSHVHKQLLIDQSKVSPALYIYMIYNMYIHIIYMYVHTVCTRTYVAPVLQGSSTT